MDTSGSRSTLHGGRAAAVFRAPLAVRLVRGAAQAALIACVYQAARQAFWPGHLPAGALAWCVGAGSLVVGAALLWAARLPDP